MPCRFSCNQVRALACATIYHLLFYFSLQNMSGKEQGFSGFVPEKALILFRKIITVPSVQLGESMACWFVSPKDLPDLQILVR